MNGVSISFIFVPLLPEILYVVGTEEGLSNNNDLNDKASGIYNVAYASGTILAPNIGGILTDLYGFRYMCDTLAIFSFCFSIIFLFANVGVRTFCDIKADPKLDSPKQKKRKEVDPRELTGGQQEGLLDAHKAKPLNQTEMTASNLDNYANTNA
jgi:MFS family permease